jgi:hypothetical protein
MWSREQCRSRIHEFHIRHSQRGSSLGNRPPSYQLVRQLRHLSADPDSHSQQMIAKTGRSCMKAKFDIDAAICPRRSAQYPS